MRAAQPSDVKLDATRPVTTVGEGEIARRQADSIFEILKDVPGVGVDGGPRAAGMKFNIRGFSDNEDVLFKIDGAVKGFEKYRFGSGVFIEPELLKAIEVERGPSVTAGSGALGGTISATTKSARDLLRPGQRAGGLAKVGYGWNNDEWLYMLSAYTRPVDSLDLLAAATQRDSQDIKLPDGSRLPVSATHSESTLLKAGWFPFDDFSLELSRTAYTSGPERAPYDANAGVSLGSFGTVRRTVDDETLNLKLQYTPAGNPWIKLRGTLAREHTRVQDLALQSEVNSATDYVPGNPAKSGTGDIHDDWRYKITTAELFNDANWRLGEVKGLLTLGVQGVKNERDLMRTTENPARTLPGGFYAAQPPGCKESSAFIAENAFTWRDFTLTPGARWDRYRLSAQGGTVPLLEAANQATDVAFSHTSPSVALTWRLPVAERAFSVTLRQAESFRPPLIDEAFTAGAFSRCLRTLAPSFPFPLYDRANKRDLAPTSGICGDLYRPETSVTREATLAWMPRAALAGARWQGRLTGYRIETEGLLESLAAENGAVVQPGREHRHGVELELNANAARWFASLGYARVSGSVERGQSLLNPIYSYSGPLYDIPGPTTTAQLGGRWLAGRLEAGLRLRDIGDRRAIVPNQPTSCSRPGSTVAQVGNVGTQFGAQLLDVFATWQATLREPEDLTLRFGVDNLTNETYCLNDGFGGAVGTQAPGRSVKLSVAWQL